MNYTENYNLPQWVKEDRIMMEDFNQMCANIETGLTNAQTTADSARSEAAELPYAVGSYVGNGSTQNITVGFRPRFVIIFGDQSSSLANGSPTYVAIASEQVSSQRLFMTDGGFQVVTISGSSDTFPRINDNNIHYNFIAFR